MAELGIIRYAETVASELGRTYARAPFDELRAWLRIAHLREAMVTELYDRSQLDARLARLDRRGAAPVVRTAVSSIWAHEESHTRFLGALRSLSDSLAGVSALQGRLEGLVTRGAVSGGLLARALIAVGVSLDRVPEFASELQHLNLRDLLQFYGELEATACMGYQRILDLTRQLEAAADDRVEGALGLTFDLDVAKIRCEENFHRDAFGEIGRWVADDGVSFLSLAHSECAHRLHDLCERNLSIEAVRRTVMPSGAIPKGADPSEGWASDGGLGALFAQYDLPVPVLARDTVVSRLKP